MEFSSINSSMPLDQDTVSALVNEVVYVGVDEVASLGNSPQPPETSGFRVPTGAPESEGQELLYSLGETIFAAVAPRMIGLGWSVFPQEQNRAPGSVFGQRINWSKEHDLRNRLPTPDAIDLWCRHCPDLNVACVFGPASGDTFAIDIDVTDEEMSRQIAELADEILGRTPFRREGRAPKLALIYRQPGGVPANGGGAHRVGSLSRYFVDMQEDGNAAKGEHGLEVLADGRLLTLHGRHHKTGAYFKWMNAAQSPIILGPAAAPLVTADQVKAFVAAVEARFPFYAPPPVAYTAAGEVNADGLLIPRKRADVVHDSSGRAVDGRWTWLKSIAWHAVLRRRDEVVAAHASGNAAIVRGLLVADAVAAFKATADCRGRWEGENLVAEARSALEWPIKRAVDGTMRGGRGNPGLENQSISGSTGWVADPAAADPSYKREEAAIPATVTDLGKRLGVPDTEDYSCDPADITEEMIEQARRDKRSEQVQDLRMRGAAATAKTMAAWDAKEALARIAERNERKAAQEARKTEEEEGTAPFRVLGYEKSVRSKVSYWFLSHTGLVLASSSRELASVSGLNDIAPTEWWVERYPGKIDHPGYIANELIKESVKVGIYKPERLRGRGFWFDGNRSVLHFGNRLLITDAKGDMQQMAPSRIDSKFVYEQMAEVELEVDVEKRATGAEIRNFARLCSSISWTEQGRGTLFAGWIVSAMLCGAMPWRSHAYVTADRGMGKSWLMTNIVRPIFGTYAQPVQGKTTEAGLRALLKTDSRPVLFEEADAEDAQGVARIKSIMELARIASDEDGPIVAKSDADGTARIYRIRSSFLFQSIGLNLTSSADQSRTIVFGVRPPAPGPKRREVFARSGRLARETMTPGFGGRLLARMMPLIPAVRESFDVLKAAVVAQGHSERVASTYGVPLACYGVMLLGRVITGAEADKLLARQPWFSGEGEVVESAPDWRRAMDMIVQDEMQLNGWTVQAGTLVEHLAYGRNTTSDYGSDKQIKGALADLGIRVEGTGKDAEVWLANSSRRLAAAFKDSPFGGSWNVQVGRAPQARTIPKGTVAFASLRSRGWAIPGAVFLGDAGE